MSDENTPENISRDRLTLQDYKERYDLTPVKVMKKFGITFHANSQSYQYKEQSYGSLTDALDAAHGLPPLKRETDAIVEVEVSNAEINSIKLFTTNLPLGCVVEAYCGLARGGTVRARNALSDTMASAKSIIGGEVKGYTKLMADTREQVISRLRLDAHSLGANAVVGIRFDSSTIGAGISEIYCYGTAVRVKEL